MHLKTRISLSGPLPKLALAVLMLQLVMPSVEAATQRTRVTEFTLGNGMHVVVVPDHRAPVVTHMVWYRVGAADEPKGVSGIAHFLEHLMFKSTDKIPMGEFSKIVSRLGGQDNAFTGQDATAYFQRIAKDRLKTVMGMEADRMVNLKLTEKEVLTERNVILEERRMRIDNNPNAILDEQMGAVLYQNHPYRIPVIGWEHEMAKLSQADALAFYKTYYAPNNAILIVTGDVTPEEVRTLAEETYGKVPSNPAVTTKRERPQEPPHRAAVRVELKDPRAGKAMVSRYYLAPSYNTADPGEAEAIDVLMKIAANGPTSRLYKKLVVESKVASSAGGYFSSYGLDGGKLSVYAVSSDGNGLDKVEAAMDAVLDEIKAKGVTAEELERAKNNYVAEYVYESDSQNQLARRYGWGLSVGRTVADIDAWPERIAKVTAAQVQSVAQKYLDLRRSVTGTLLPVKAEGTAAGTGAGATPGRS